MEVCYGNIFYFWSLETRLFSRHLFLYFWIDVHFIFVNLLWERGQGVKAVLVKLVLCKQFHIVANSFCLGLNQWTFVYSVLLGLNEWKLGEFFLIYIFKSTSVFGFSDQDHSQSDEVNQVRLNSQRQGSNSWIHLLFWRYFQIERTSMFCNNVLCFEADLFLFHWIIYDLANCESKIQNEEESLGISKYFNDGLCLWSRI